MKKVIPQGLNYADVKPEVIEHDVKVNTFRPVQTGQFKGNDIIRFTLQGNGFLDPYSTYLKFSVTFPDVAMVDMSNRCSNPTIWNFSKIQRYLS